MPARLLNWIGSMDSYEAIWGKYSQLPERIVTNSWGELIDTLKRKFPTLTERDWAELEQYGTMTYLDCPRLAGEGLDYIFVGEEGWEEWR